MEQALQRIKKASEGLLYRSESDYPFEVVHLNASSTSLEQDLIKLSTNITDVKVEKVTLEHFIRNMVKVYPDASSEQEMMALKNKNLQDILQHELQDVSVYRIGKIQIDAFNCAYLNSGS